MSPPRRPRRSARRLALAVAFALAALLAQPAAASAALGAEHRTLHGGRPAEGGDPQGVDPNRRADLGTKPLGLRARLVVDWLSLALFLVLQQPGAGPGSWRTPLFVALRLNWALRILWRIAARQRTLRPAREAATTKSTFLPGVAGLEDVHCILSSGAALLAPIIGGPHAVWHLHHGFGANCFSYLDVITNLTTATAAVAVAHDRPGLGLTTRPRKTAMYGVGATAGLAQALDEDARAVPKSAAKAPRIIVGHSMGAGVAVAQALSDPRTACLVLVDPVLPGNGLRATAGAALAPVLRPLLLALRPALVWPLRAAVYTRAFWQTALSLAAWGKAAPLTENTLDRYRRPSLCDRWDVGLIRLAAAQLTSGREFSRLVAAAAGGERDAAAALRAAGIPVLVIHGKKDRIQSWKRSRDLVAAIGAKAKLEVEAFSEAGHCPQEEQFCDFQETVLAWLRTLPRDGHRLRYAREGDGV